MMRIKLSQSDWESIGKRMGWLKAAAGEKTIILPNEMGTVTITKNNKPEGDQEWIFEYNGVKGVITKGWSRMGGGGFSISEITDKDGFKANSFHGTYKTISDAVIRGTEHMRWLKEKSKKP